MNKFAFLVPFYNHPQNIKALVRALLAYDLPVIIVDDGSDETSKAVLREVASEDVLLLERAQNGGKGIAMKDGLKFALERGFSHVLQIDADFQHDAGLIGEFLKVSEARPRSIVCANPIYGEDAPKSRAYGRKITNFWVAINALTLGIKDAMCGFRVYPLNELKKATAQSKTNRMEFDIEILVNAVRQGIDVRWIDMRVRYETGGVSHFKMLRDNSLISLMHAKCFFSLPAFAFNKISRAVGAKFKKKNSSELSEFNDKHSEIGRHEGSLETAAREQAEAKFDDARNSPAKMDFRAIAASQNTLETDAQAIAAPSESDAKFETSQSGRTFQDARENVGKKNFGRQNNDEPNERDGAKDDVREFQNLFCSSKQDAESNISQNAHKTSGVDKFESKFDGESDAKTAANTQSNAKFENKSKTAAPQEPWWKKQERGGAFFLKLSLVLTQILPEFVLKFIVKIVVLFYYVFSKNERENIAEFRRNLSEFAGEETIKETSVFSHFYEFGIAICDKFRVWKGKIGDNELDIVDLEQIKSELIGTKKGRILLAAHLGNVEICKALGARVDGFRMVILAYDKNSRKFNDILKRIGKNDESVRVMVVNELDVAAMLELKNIVESGAHIGIMGDRTPLGGDKSMRVKFLGKEADFNYGPYLIAGILGVKISSLWCQKIEGKFRIELVSLTNSVKLGRDKAKSVREYLEIYVRELENRCKQTPAQWFNFFNFWR